MLKKYQQVNQFQIIPDKSTYVQSDCHFIDRDKSSHPFFVNYDNTSFENKSLSSQIFEKRTYKQMMEDKTWFNESFKPGQGFH